MVSKLGIYSLLAGLFLGLFSGISTFMSADNIWVDLTISTLLGEDRTEGIVNMFSSVTIQNGLDAFLYDWPLFLIVLGLGCILLLISLFVKEH